MSNGPITLQTYGSLLEYGYSIQIYCEDCNRRTKLDLSRMNPMRRFVADRYRCTSCGGRGKGILSPPSVIDDRKRTAERMPDIQRK